MQPKVATNSSSSCLSFPKVEIKNIHSHVQFRNYIFEKTRVKQEGKARLLLKKCASYTTRKCNLSSQALRLPKTESEF
jgi:hypothetical protein